MKLILITILALFSNSPSWGAAKQTLLTCLGKEEATIHKNHLEGPLYTLNQQLINEVINLDEVPVKKQYLDQICADKSDFSPSVNFLRILLVEGKKIFDTESKTGDSSTQMKIYAIESITAHAPGIFFAYLSALQAMAKTPSCLDKKLPDLAFLMDRFRYLETELTVEALLKEKEHIFRIFSGLKNLDAIMKECEPKKKGPLSATATDPSLPNANPNINSNNNSRPAE